MGPCESVGPRSVPCKGPEVTGRRGDGRSGMTDKDSSPHIAALQELEAALDAHRRTQAAAGAFAHADAVKRSSRRGWIARLWTGGKPGRRLSSNPSFRFDR